MADNKITVIKRNPQGLETYRYRGELVKREAGQIILEARFDREDMEFHGMQFEKGDRFVETYFTDRWYNIFEIHAREDDRLKGWYCNVGLPAEFENRTLSYIDLALDLLVFPDGHQLVLDEDEFDLLEISESIRKQARTALAELQESFSNPAFLKHILSV